ncbi:ketoacyl-ACP synthase III family protein [Streptomyces sp. bgisy100]|uniref:ketoacyl-ACP synthase III family protein n=1 Tax=Streptomyces sp. bgisy100 TaxID=3413783 RepID=UPI003D736C48
MRIEGIHLAATGAYIPPRVSTREAVERGWYEQELVDSCGWRSIAVADGTPAPDMAVAAARQAFERSGLGREDIDLLVHTCAYHQGPDGWSAPHYILRGTLNTPIPALTVDQGCNGFLAGIETATQYLLAAPGRTGALVTSADNFGAPSVDRWHAHRDAVLADAGTAVVLSKRHGWARLRSVESVSLPEFEVLNRGHEPLFPPALTVGKQLDMNEHLEAMIEELGPQASRIVQDYGAAGGKLVEQLTAEAGIAVSDLTAVLHLGAGTTAFLESHLQPMGLDAALGDVPYFREVGHAGACDIGLQLNHLAEDGLLSVGDHLLMLSSGPGIMITAAVVEVVAPPALGPAEGERTDTATGSTSGATPGAGSTATPGAGTTATQGTGTTATQGTGIAAARATGTGTDRGAAW